MNMNNPSMSHSIFSIQQCLVESIGIYVKYKALEVSCAKSVEGNLNLPTASTRLAVEMVHLS